MRHWAKGEKTFVAKIKQVQKENCSPHILMQVFKNKPKKATLKLHLSACLCRRMVVQAEAPCICLGAG